MAKKAPEEIALERIKDAVKEGGSELDLSRLGLKELPTEIGSLINITSLDLSSNQLTTLPSEIGGLSNLRSLILKENLITTLPLEFRGLDHLEFIDFRHNSLRSIPSEIYLLENLKRLWLGEYFDPARVYYQVGLPHNPNAVGVGGIQSAIGNLTDLIELIAPYNDISSLPIEITKLKHLTNLDIRGNKYLELPHEIEEKTREPAIILNYYFNLQRKKSRAICEAKVLLVGQGSVGKTSLVERLILGKFNVSESKTEGISIKRWIVANQFKIKNQQSRIYINLWDFGGQEIMHATHQFFLTKRSLYLLVLDSRLTQEENRVEYWLKIIQSFGGESPVLIVGNKIDQHPLDIDRTGLQKKYPNIVGILETSAATGAGIEALKAAITEQVNSLPHVRDLLPETWFTVKTKLEGLGRESNFITHDKYLELCAENEVNDETSQRTLIGFLHDLGVVLHFQDDPRLEALGILNPQWVTNGVYKILNSHALFQNKGVLTVSMLDEILNLPEYPRGKRLFIVDMMKKFELCYDIEPDKTFLVPDLLPKDQPDLNFNGVPAFEYAYPVLPSSVITRFIVRMNQKIDDGFVWRTGVVLKIGENKALVKADIEDRKITIAIDGIEHTRRGTLSAILFELDEIHASIKGLNPQKRVPIPEAPNAEPLEYEYLLMLERAGDETCRVKDGNRLVTVNVRQVLSAIEHETERKERGMTNIHIGNITIGENAKVGDIILASEIQESVRKAESSNIPPELMETLKLLGAAVDVMNKVLPKEQATETTEDFGKLVDEATKPTPQKKWYLVSLEGLIKAAENVEKVGVPVINLSRKVLSLLTAGLTR